jgi:Ribonuclease G/E
MSGRRYYLDISPGERRAVVTLDARPEHLIIERDGEGAPRFGARYAARIRQVERGLGMAFLDLGGGQEAVAPIGRLALQIGAAVEVEITAEARSGKAATGVIDGAANREPGLVRPAPDAISRLHGLAGGAPITEGAEARQAADEAEDAVLASEHELPGGGSLAIEPTRALVAIDVDQGARGGGDAARAARQTNFAAIGHAARLLRLKALGGLVVFDLVGKGQDGEAVVAAGRKAFEPDQPGVVFGPVSKLGTFTLALPQRYAPTREHLVEADGRPTPRAAAQRLLRALDREGRADPGALLDAVCAPEVAAVLRPLAEQLGPRFGVIEEVGRARQTPDIRRR